MIASLITKCFEKLYTHCLLSPKILKSHFLKKWNSNRDGKIPETYDNTLNIEKDNSMLFDNGNETDLVKIAIKIKIQKPLTHFKR